MASANVRAELRQVRRHFSGKCPGNDSAAESVVQNATGGVRITLKKRPPGMTPGDR